MTRTSHLAPFVEELIAALDETIDLEVGAIHQLQDLSEAALSRRTETLESVMDRLNQTQNRLGEVNEHRESLRAKLAEHLDCTVDEITLTGLAKRVPELQAEALRGRRERIRNVAEGVRRQHLETAVLLAEFAKVNRSLLEGLLAPGAETRTYGAGGHSRWRANQGLLDART